MSYVIRNIKGDKYVQYDEFLAELTRAEDLLAEEQVAANNDFWKLLGYFEPEASPRYGYDGVDRAKVLKRLEKQRFDALKQSEKLEYLYEKSKRSKS